MRRSRSGRAETGQDPRLPSRLPKAELHLHLDGSLRPGTLLELARAEGVKLPTLDPEELADHMVPEPGGTLETYLERFELTLAVLQTRDGLSRAARELVVDAAAENVRYLEIRFCPALNTRRGLSLDAVLEAALEGAAAGTASSGAEARFIVCGLRNLSPTLSVELAELAVAFRDRGVVAYDIAGGEAGNPVRDHAEAFTVAARGGLFRTVHAGEAWGPDSIRQALVEGRAQRIGHGTRLHEDPALMEVIRDQRIPLEICLTSNLQTGASRDYRTHPLRRYFDFGIPVSLNTDNRLMSGTTLSREFHHARVHQGFGDFELMRLARMGFEAAFLPWPEKAALLAAVELELEGLAEGG
ncbi:MAG: adenosine deaminase [Gemmatimonadota bacterium]